MKVWLRVKTRDWGMWGVAGCAEEGKVGTSCKEGRWWVKEKY